MTFSIQSCPLKQTNILHLYRPETSAMPSDTPKRDNRLPVTPIWSVPLGLLAMMEA